MSLSSYCRNCGAAYTTVAEMAALHCNNCEEKRKGAMQFAKEQNPAISESDLLYAGRTALIQAAHHPRQTFINPREFNRADMDRK